MSNQQSIAGAKCPECGKGTLVSLNRNEDFDFDLGVETVKVRAEDVPIEQCDTCGEVMSGPAGARVRHEAVCRAVGLLTPAEIKSLREKFGWSQQHLADLTDYGVATVSRWERGRLLQNRSANKVLLALRDCAAFRSYLKGLGSPAGEKTAEPTPALDRDSQTLGQALGDVFAKFGVDMQSQADSPFPEKKAGDGAELETPRRPLEDESEPEPYQRNLEL